MWCAGEAVVFRGKGRYSHGYPGSHGGDAPGAAAAAATAATSGAVRTSTHAPLSDGLRNDKLSQHEEASHSNVQRLLMSESV